MSYGHLEGGDIYDMRKERKNYTHSHYLLVPVNIIYNQTNGQIVKLFHVWQHIVFMFILQKGDSK